MTDLATTAAYFQDALGFVLEWPLESGWQVACRGSVRVMLGQKAENAAPPLVDSQGYFAYLRVSDAHAFHRELVLRGAQVLYPPIDRIHRMREFLVGTPDGHRLMIGQTLDAGTRARRVQDC